MRFGVVSVFTISRKIRMIFDVELGEGADRAAGPDRKRSGREDHESRPAARRPARACIGVIVSPRPMRPITIAASASSAEISARCSGLSERNLILRPEEQQRGERDQAR